MASSFKLLAASLITAGLLTACGGGDGADVVPKAKVTSVKVMGDSLSDSGTFGYKFTVQGSDAEGPFKVWPERIAAAYNVSLCPHYASADGASFATKAGCTNYAVGGGRINYTAAPTAPISITQQIIAAGAVGFGPDDLVLIDGGANDAADAIGAFLAASSDQGATFAKLMGTKVDGPTLQALLAQGQAGMAKAGGLYMQNLAKEFAGNIQTNVVGKGATRVAVLNTPGITRTPRFRMVLAGLAQRLGSTAAEQLEVVFDGWVKAFNQQLATSLAGDKRVAVVDFYTELNNQISNPAQFKFSNVTKAACPVTGVASNGLPVYTFPTCTATSLSTNIPVGETSPDWWKSYGFADSFHPTPYGHQQMGQLVSRTLAQAGWL